LTEIYSFFGVKTTFQNNEIILEKMKQPLADFYECDLQNAPDIAQTVMVTCFGLGVACKLTGLHTLKIKETDRLEAMKTELKKLGATVTATESALQLEKRTGAMRSEIAINTYNDHRMAMAFTPLMLKTSLVICDCEVVSKSYPNFWSDVFEVTKSKSS
ncbi:MAG: 3-phosphoshikimate 1-carboxyvinyltransferase, partial [Capnocytophaga sp.]|nr:3-phosphoshikimate 1-carboxyvinyltransferase [Capnocytophaga sp.]